jgi:hypothetical protein
MLQERNIQQYSYNELIHIIHDLKYEFVQMKKEFSQLKSKEYIPKTIKKEKSNNIVTSTMCIDWLNDNKQNVNIENYIENLIIEDKYLDLLEERNIYDVLYVLVERKSIPIYNINNMYYYNLNNNWVKCTYEDIEKYLHKIVSKIWNILLEWQKIHILQIKNDENIQKSYHLRLQNICNKNNKTKIFTKIKDNLIEKIKI